MKKNEKILIKDPFPKLKDNWELVTKMESSLNKILQDAHIHTNIQTDKKQGPLSIKNIQKLLKLSKQLLNTIDALKNQQKQHQIIQTNSHIVQQKLEQHDSLMANLQKNYNQKLKSIMQENKGIKDQMQKNRRMQSQFQENGRELIKTLKQQNKQLIEKCQKLQRQNTKMLTLINEKQEEIRLKNQLIQKLKNAFQTQQKQITVKKKLEAYYQKKLSFDLIAQVKLNQRKMSQDLMDCCIPFQQVLSDFSVSSLIVSYLHPKDIANLFFVNRQTRFLLLKSKHVVLNVFKSIIGQKNRQISYFHQHINYFEKLCNKIPQQILQTTFYQYHILKENIGGQILGILNSSAAIFQGKFIDVDQQDNSFYDSPKKSKSSNKIVIPSQKYILDVDQDIISEYLQQKTQQRQKNTKQIDLMYKKIQNTAQLYSADVQSIGLFLKNVMKNFSKVFVLSKNLYSQARNLQQLNIFLLNQLNTWDKVQIQKNYEYQDIRAELQAQKKLKQFFTEKALKSQQRALTQQNSKLTIQMKYNKLAQSSNTIVLQRDDLKKKIDEVYKNNKQIVKQNKQLKKIYEASKQKYNKIIEELNVVKQTILRMNIV